MSRDKKMIVENNKEILIGMLPSEKIAKYLKFTIEEVMEFAGKEADSKVMRLVRGGVKN